MQYKRPLAQWQQIIRYHRLKMSASHFSPRIAFFIWFLLLLLLLGVLHTLVLFNTDLFSGYTKLLVFCTEV